ncbi:MAG: type II CAAX endopeptidase family protein [Proteobacteria bacterium]|nr:type II CAAX endopeptidase family protein [Pseudomonadota bacterium]
MYHFEPAIAGAIVAAAMATFLLVGSFVPRAYALPVGQLILLAVPVGIAIASARGAWSRVLGIRRPRAIFIVAAMLIGVAAWYVNLRLVELLPFRMPTGPLEDLVERPPLVIVIVSLAVLPAICEEVLFRGVLARSLASTAHVAVAVVLSAALFSFYHLSLVQAAPTFLLGLALGWLALRADSIVPAMLVHALNNLAAIVIARDEIPALTSGFRAHPQLALVACGALVATGVTLTVVARPDPIS